MHLPPTEKLITTKEAGEISGYTPDYLARLARAGKVTGRRVGHSWLIDRESLTNFLDQQSDRKIGYARALARAREVEYRAHRSTIHRATRALTKQLSMPQPLATVAGTDAGSIAGRFRSQALALSVALAVVVSGALVARAAAEPRLAHMAAEFAGEAASGFGVTFGTIPSHIIARIEKAGTDMRAPSERLPAGRHGIATNTANASAEVASSILSDINLSSLQMAIDDQHVSRITLAPNSPAHAFSAPTASITIEDVQTDVLAAYTFVTTPSLAANTLARAYVAFGTDTYATIRASFSAYHSLIERAGEETLALAATTRDAIPASRQALATTPRLVDRMNLALGTVLIEATHAAIRADVATAYGMADAAPASARETVALMGTAGNTLIGVTARAPTLAVALYLRATSAPATLAPRMAQAVFGAEYMAAARFIAIAGSVSENYLALVESTGRLAYAGTTGALALSDVTVSRIAHVPLALENVYLGTLGKNALALDTPSLLAAALPTLALRSLGEAGLSTGERTALATYESINGFMRSTTDALALLFAPPTIVLPTPGFKHPALTSTPFRPASRPAISNSYPTYTTVVQGVSSSTLNSSLLALRTDVLGTVAGMLQPVAAQGVTNMNSIQQVNMIQDLSNLIVRNGDFRGGTFSGGNLTNGIYVGATTGHFDNLTGGTLSFGAASFATTTVTGGLSVSGTLTPATISASNTISAPYFIATSSTASAFPYASSTAVTVSGADGLSLGSLNGPLQANNGAVSATTSIGVLYGGTGWTNIQTGAIPYGNGSAALSTTTQGTAGYVLAYLNGIPTWTATSSINNGVTAVTGTYPVQSSGGTTPAISLAFGTTTSNTWANTQTFTNPIVDGTLSGLIAGNSGATYQVSTTSMNASITGNAGNVTGTVAVANGGTGQTSFSASQLLYGNGTSALSSVATSSVSYGLGFTTGGTFGALVGGSTPTLAIATSSLYSGATGQFPYFSGTNTLTATSSIFLATSGNVGIGTTSPQSRLAVSGGLSVGADYNTAAPSNGAIIEGNVGIGTTSPLSKLAVSGGASIGADYNIAAPTNGLIVEGKVGIGTASPNVNYTLDVNGYINASLYYVSGVGSLGRTGGRLDIGADSSYSSVALSPGGSPLVTVLSSGNVGIGTTSPLSLFSVGTAGNAFRVDSTGTVKEGVWNGSTIAVANGGTGQTTFSASQLLYGNGTSALSSVATSSVSYGLGFTTGGTFGALVGGSTPTLAIATSSLYSGTTGQLPYFSGTNTLTATSSIFLATSGNVGIGTTTPSSTLHVVGTFQTTGASTFGGQLTVPLGSTGSPSIIPTGGSNTGIFFRDPGRLSISSGGTEVLEFTGGNAVFSGLNSLGWAPSTNPAITPDINISRISAGVLGVGSGIQGSVAGILTAASIGVGTAVPSSTLSVAGGLAVGATYAISPNIAPTNGAIIQGNVGVGTTSPYRTLSVSGSGVFTGGDVLASTFTATSSITAASLSLTTALPVSSGGTGQTSFSASQLLYGNGTSALSSVATSSVSYGLGFTTGGTFGALVGGSTPTLAIATSSLYSGTTGQFPYFSGTNTLTATSSIFLASSGNVGIGTTGPGYKLDVNGTAQFSGTTNIGGSYWLQFNGFNTVLGEGTNTYVQANGAGSIIFRNNTPSELVRITNTGNVGIGTTSPAQLLSVAGNGYFAGGLGVGTTETAAGNITGTGRLSITSTTATSTFSTGGLTVGGSQFVVQQTSGNVGIGTTSPVSKFVVSDTNDTVMTVTNTSNTGNTYLNINKDSTLGGMSAVRFQRLGVNKWVAGNSGGNSDSFFIGTNGDTNPQFWINTSGLVGIGTTSPATTLSVSGNGYLTGGLGVGIANTTAGTLQTSGLITGGTTLALSGTTGTTTIASGQGLAIGGSQFVVQQTSGNVGIGTAAPIYPLEIIRTTSGTNLSFTSGSTNAQNYIRFNKNNATIPIGYIGANTGETTFGFFGNGNDTFLATNSDGSNNPTGAYVYLKNSTGNVGIGTTSPSQALSVQGNGLFSGNLSLANLTATGTATIGSLSGVVGANAGTLYAVASSSLFGFMPASNAITISGTYPLTGGGDLTANRTLSLAFGTTTSNTWANTQTFTNAPTLATLSGLIAGNSGATYAVSTTSLNASITGQSGSVATSVTFNSAGAGAASGSTWNGSSALTVSYNTIGAQAAGSYESPLTFTAPLLRSSNTVSWFGLATTSQPSSSNLLVSNGTSGVYGAATSSPTFNGGLTTSGTAGALVGGSSFTVSLANVNGNSLLGCAGSAACTPTSVATSSLFQNASANTSGLLTNTDWSTFNNKVSTTRAVNTTYPLQGGGDLSADRTLSLAFGTTTSNTWAGTQTFTNPIVDGTLSGLIAGNSGTTYAVSTTSLNASITGTAGNVTGTVAVANGGTGQTSFSASQLLYGNSTNALSSVATSSPTLGLGLSYSGTLGALVGGASGSLTVATSSLYSGTAGQFPYFSGTNTLTATSSIFLATSGNVGIGTTSPSQALSVQGNGLFTGSLNFNSQGTIYAISNGGGISTYGVAGLTSYLGHPSNAAYSSINNRLRVGDLNLPNAPLDVVGNALISGNVGIGTTSPSSTLSIQGNQYTSGTSFFGGAITATSTLNVTGLATLGNASTSQITNSGSIWLTGLSASSLIATDANKLLVSTTSIGVSNLALPKGNFLVGNDAGVAQATSSIFIGSTGNIGIGTSTPNQLLTIAPPSNQRAKAGLVSTSGAGSQIFMGDNGVYAGAIGWNQTVSEAMQFAVGSGVDLTNDTNFANNTRLSILSSGNVGIGTTSPSQALSVQGNGLFTGSLNFNSQGTIYAISNGGGISTYGVAGLTSYLGHPSNAAYSSINNRLRVGDLNLPNAPLDVVGNALISGNVGIGTTSPYRTLSVSGSGVFTGGDVLASTFTATSSISSPSLTLTGLSVNSLLSTNATGLVVATSTPTFGNFNATSTVATSTLSTGGLTVGTSQFVVQQTSGNVGIGIANPGSALDVQAITGQIYLKSTTATNRSGVWFNNGSGDSFVGIESSGGGSWVSGSTGYATVVGNGGANPVQLATNNAVRMTINSSGNVGVGTTNPKALLFVHSSTDINMGFRTLGVGTNGSDMFAVNDANNAYVPLSLNGSKIVLNTDSGGNVGINNTSPSYKLDVAGFINTDQYSGYKQAGNTVLYASTTNFSLAVGDSAAPWMNATSSGFYSTAVGYNALNATPTTGTAQYNTALGYAALYSDTAGDRGVAVGAYALQNNTTGSSNVALGYSALKVSNADQNVAVGSYTLESNTTGTSNTAIGYDVADFNTTGANNTAVGRNAFQKSTTGNYNTAVGMQALYNNISATSTTALGFSAGYGAGGNYNNQGGTYIGFETGYNSATGSDYNTLLGYQSGYDITTGTNNTILGQFVTTGAGITQGSNNIIIGQGVRAGLSQTGSNQLNIGNLIFGTGLSSGATLSTGNIGIGTTSPNSTLTVAGTNNGPNAWFESNQNNGGIAINTSVAGGHEFGLLSSSAAASTPSSFRIYDYTAAADRFIINSTGNVGIGTTSPGSLFSVGGTGTGWNFFDNATTTSYARGIDLKNGGCFAINGTCVGGGSGSGTVGSGTTGQFPYYAANGTTLTATSSLFLSSSGNVGIGTTTAPSGIGERLTVVAAGGAEGGIQISNGTGSGGGVINTLSTAGGLNFYTYTGGVGAESYSERVRINSSGNVGIGTTSPNWLLQVAGTRPSFALSDTAAGANLKHWLFSSMGGNLYIGTSTDVYGTSTPAALSILNNGKLGVGTTSPYALLSVAGLAAAGYFNADNAAATSTLAGGINVNSGAFMYDFGANKTYVERLSTGPLSFEANSGDVSWIDMPVTSAASSGTYESYSAQLNANQMLTVWGESDGAGGILKTRVVVGTTTDANLDNGNIPFGSFIVSDGALCVDNNGGASCAGTALTRGQLYAKSATVGAVDLAENYPTEDATLAPGEIVAADPANPLEVVRYGSTIASSTPSIVPLGIVSTAPGFLLGVGKKGGPAVVPVALAGRVPLKVSLANGPINIGDYIAPSPTMPGYGVKATKSGMMIGMALEATDATRSTDSIGSPQGDSGQVATSTDTAVITTFVRPQFAFVGGGSSLSIPLGGTVPSFDTSASSTDSFFSNLVAATTTSAVLTADGTSLDIFKLATFSLRSAQALAAKISAHELRLASLEDRVAKLESGAVSTAGGTPATFSTTSLASALQSFGVLISKGFAQFAKIAADNLQVGSPAHPTGITMYDKTTGQPYCFQIDNGSATTTPGECVAIAVASAQTAATVTTLSTSTTITATASTTDSGLPTGQAGTTASTTTTATVATSSPQATATAVSADTTPPVVTLTGAAALQINVGDTFTDPGATALDTVDGNLTTHIIVSGSVNAALAGLYQLTYSATDAAGNTGSASRVVTVAGPSAVATSTVP